MNPFHDGGYMAFDPGAGIPELNRVGTEIFRFGCFNHARKLSDATIALFCCILKKCPQSTLLLKSITFHEEDEKQRIRKRFEQHRIQADRLIILDWIKGGLNHLACYNLIDAALDPFPYGGATTTAEALWMGVPVVTEEIQSRVALAPAYLIWKSTSMDCGDQENPRSQNSLCSGPATIRISYE